MSLRYVAAAFCCVISWDMAIARAQQPPKWGAHVDLEGKLGTDRHLGEVDLFLPVAQNHRSLLFGDIRTRLDDAGGREGNFGVGVRTMLDSGWNLGGYGYFDRRRSEYHNYFNQVTLGGEALSRDWDLRANAYVPIGRTSRREDSLNTAEISGTSVIFKGGEERALGGFDAEIGWRVPVFDADGAVNLRAYAGGYRFADDDVPTIAGPRGRLEMVFDEVPHLWGGSRLSLGAEWQRDDPRGSQGFLTARLRIPLQAEVAVARLTPMERRMTDPIVRDIDIVSQAGTFGPGETTSQLASGGGFSVLDSASTSGAGLAAAVTAAGNNSTVLLNGSFNVGATTVSLATGQTLTNTLTVRSASGRTATLSTSAAVNGTNASRTLLVNTGGTVSGLTVTNAFSGGSGGQGILVADNSTNVTIANTVVTVTQSGANGAVALSMGANTTGTVRGNSLTVTGSGGATTMSAFAANSGSPVLTVAGNSLSSSGGTTNNIVLSGANTTFNAGSTGNIRGSGNCSGTALSGSVAFTNGTSCP